MTHTVSIEVEYIWATAVLYEGSNSHLLRLFNTKEMEYYFKVKVKNGFNVNLCVSVGVCPYIFGIQQVLAAFIAVGVRRHLQVDTGVISAG